MKKEGMPTDIASLHRAVLDEANPAVAEKQHARGELTARERIRILLDEKSHFIEYGALAQPWGGEHAPADALICGLGQVNGEPAVVASSDFTHLGGSIGVHTARKLGRALKVAEDLTCPLFFLAEGGGGRASETTAGFPPRREALALSRLSGRIPTVGIAFSRAFGEHTVILGMCDTIFATRQSVLGVAGPPFVRSAFGMKVTPQEIGAVAIHEKSGAVDFVADSDAEAILAARAYTSLLTDKRRDYSESDESQNARRQALAQILPDNPRQTFDGKSLSRLVADHDSILELRPNFGGAILTELARIGGRSVGIITSQSMVQAGGLSSSAIDKMVRFARLCDAFGLPLVFLVDTPGLSVGRAAEEQATFRHAMRMVHVLVHLRVAFVTVYIRKRFGAAGMIMGGEEFEPLALACWPSADAAGMAFGASARIVTPGDRAGSHRQAVDRDEDADHLSDMRNYASALGMARRAAADDVIDPSDTRQWLERIIAVLPDYSVPRTASLYLDQW